MNEELAKLYFPTRQLSFPLFRNQKKQSPEIGTQLPGGKLQKYRGIQLHINGMMYVIIFFMFVFIK